MAETSSSRVEDAMRDDGFVDYYQLLGVAPAAPTEELRVRINELYSDAQANRDHRNLAKRRDYQLLLELLPQARKVLLDDDNRAAYDAYAEAARRGEATQSFEEFLDELTGGAATDSNAEERSSILGVKDATAATATVGSTTQQGAQTPARRTTVTPDAQKSIAGTAISVLSFFVVWLGLLALHMPKYALLAGAVIGIAVWVISHYASSGRTRV
jgi:hypothetical protein